MKVWALTRSPFHPLRHECSLKKLVYLCGAHLAGFVLSRGVDNGVSPLMLISVTFHCGDPGEMRLMNTIPLGERAVDRKRSCPR